MKTFAILFLSCASLSGADTDIQIVTTTKTNATSDIILTQTVFMRDGQTNLIRDTMSTRGKVTGQNHKFYHDGYFVGEIKSMADFSVFTGASDCPYLLEGFYRTNGGVWQADIRTKEGIVLDHFIVTNGIFWPAPKSDVQNLKKMTTDVSHAHAKMMEHIPK